MNSFDEAARLLGDKRKPRVVSKQFTPRALELFRRLKMSLSRCTCPRQFYINDAGLLDKHRCIHCETAIRLNYELCDELRLKPWQDRAVQHPDAKNPFPPNVSEVRRRQWQPDVEAQERWCQLEAASE